MSRAPIRVRVATAADLPALRELIPESVRALSRGYYTPEQIESAIRHVFGVDTQLIEDGTYFAAEANGALAGCGGWSRRATLYGGDASPGRDAALLDPAKEPARVRAMYTHPDFTRRGVGRLILDLCESAAQTEGFASVELMATMAGVPLYRACGYLPIEDVVDARGGTPVPLLRMRKRL